MGDVECRVLSAFFEIVIEQLLAQKKTQTPSFKT